MFLQVFGYQKWSVLVAPCTKRSAMLILGTIRSFRASGFNLFSRPKFLRLGLPKRFGLWMSRDCACFLVRLRNAGAYIPFWDTLYAPRFYKFTHERMSRYPQPKSHFRKLLQGGLYRRVSICHIHLHINAYTTNSHGGACQFERLMCLDQ